MKRKSIYQDPLALPNFKTHTVSTLGTWLLKQFQSKTIFLVKSHFNQSFFKLPFITVFSPCSRGFSFYIIAIITSMIQLNIPLYSKINSSVLCAYIWINRWSANQFWFHPHVILISIWTIETERVSGCELAAQHLQYQFLWWNFSAIPFPSYYLILLNWFLLEDKNMPISHQQFLSCFFLPCWSKIWIKKLELEDR